MAKRKTITIMTPVFNEFENIQVCYETVRDYFERVIPQYDLEHLIIDNASTDDTFEILKKIASEDKRVKVIRNSRNFGPHNSPYHAILESSGDALIPIMADLQTPVDKIAELVKGWEEGFKLVLGVRTSMQEDFLIKSARKLYYRVVEQSSYMKQVPHFLGFGLFDKAVINILRELDDPVPYFRGLIFEIGFKKKLVYYDQPARERGQSKQTLWGLINYAIVGITSYSTAPLRMLTVLAVFMSAISSIIFLFYLTAKFILWEHFDLGILPILLIVLFFGSVQIVAVGILGEYIGLLLSYSRRRPLVIEEERLNFEKSK